MKCDNCKKDIIQTMHYCPYCSYDLTNQISIFKKKRKKKNIITFTIIGIIIISLFIVEKAIGINYLWYSINNKNELDDMVTSICNGNYDIVYKDKDFKDQGIYQCKNNSYVYYVHTLMNNKSGEMYELGYTNSEIVEKMFPSSIYFYRESRVTSIPSELKIALEANSEEDLINKYSEKLYGFIKNLNVDYRTDIQLMIYFNDSFSDINSTYDKLFLMADYNTNNVTQAYGMGTQYGKYILNDGDPYELLNTIFSDRKKYPTNALNAIKNNRNIKIKIVDGKTVTYDDFVERLKNSFKDTF